MNSVTFQNYTNLPVKEIVKAGGTGSALEVTTPTGKEIIEYKGMRYGLFSSTQVDETAEEIIGRLQKIEIEARDYLFDKWKSGLKDLQA